jgi:hypothetical protein
MFGFGFPIRVDPTNPWKKIPSDKPQSTESDHPQTLGLRVFVVEPCIVLNFAYLRVLRGKKNWLVQEFQAPEFSQKITEETEV